jgi:hypothetical protein
MQSDAAAGTVDDRDESWCRSTLHDERLPERATHRVDALAPWEEGCSESVMGEAGR